MAASDRIRLGDDGTMDTVLICRQCGAESRYNYQGELENVSYDEPDDAPMTYDTFIEWAMEDFDSEHECGSDD